MQKVGICLNKRKTVDFGGIQAVNDLSLEVDEGKLTALIGPTGSGKTTLFNVITGITQATRSRILFDGQDVGGMRSHGIREMGIARTFQNICLFNARECGGERHGGAALSHQSRIPPLSVPQQESHGPRGKTGVSRLFREGKSGDGSLCSQGPCGEDLLHNDELKVKYPGG
jgi:energy-coupling factor transporter ATP-binding protein EcfA2